MRNFGFMNEQEKKAFRSGYECGMREGLKKAGLLIQLMASNSEDFESYIIQNSKEVIELRKIFSEEGEK